MRKTSYIVLVLLVSVVLMTCRQRQRKGAFQGTWYKQGFEMEAFSVRGDSLYFPGLQKGYKYQFKKDTIIINFTNRQTKSQIIAFSSRKLSVWDMSLTNDTVYLIRSPRNMLEPLDDG